MEMSSVGKDFIEDTYGEIDEDSKGFIEKEDMFKYLQGTWDLKQWLNLINQSKDNYVQEHF